DVSFYVDEALKAASVVGKADDARPEDRPPTARRVGGEVVELGVGTGRIAIPTALAGVQVIGIDSSPGMLAVCAERAREAGVGERLGLRVRDPRRPPGGQERRRHALS